MKIFKGLLGLFELTLVVWGIITFWNTPWSIVAIIYLSFCLLAAMFETGKEMGVKYGK